MNLHAKAVFALLLALSAASLGAWAEFWPRGFFRSLPLSGHSWVFGLGPYNEHFVRDFRSLYLALAMCTLFAIKAGSPEGYRSVGAAWSTFALRCATSQSPPHGWMPRPTARTCVRHVPPVRGCSGQFRWTANAHLSKDIQGHHGQRGKRPHS